MRRVNVAGSRRLTGANGLQSPLWREQLALLGRTEASIATAAELATLPALGERDVSPTGDPAGMARLVVHGGEAGFALHAPGAVVRQALLARLRDRTAYRQIVDSETRATTFAWTGSGFRWPVAYTRGDIDVVARAGARAWRRLGLTPDDAVLATSPPSPEPSTLALQYAALATGTPLVATEPTPEAVAAAARLTPPTVVAVPPGRADLVAVAAAASRPGRLTTVLLLGVPGTDERAAAADAAGVPVTVLVWHVPAGGRLPWVECGSGGPAAGLHSEPDLEVVHLVDPETGEAASDDRGGEVVLTQLGMRGSALLRWRTGDLACAISTTRCPGCGDECPRLQGVRSGELVAPTDRSGRLVDLRAVAGALTGRADLADWRVVVGERARDGEPEVVVHLTPLGTGDPPTKAVAGDVTAVAGTPPSRLVVATPEQLAALDRTDLTAVTRRIRRRSARH